MATVLELVESMAVGVELVELGKTIQRRQRLPNLTSRVIENGIIKLGQEKKAQAELAEKPLNCTTVTGKSGEPATRKDMIFGLQMMGVFTLCNVLATLGWGGVTSILDILARAWTTKPPKESTDASTNTDMPGNRRVNQPLKPTSVSFRDERARWE